MTYIARAWHRLAPKLWAFLAGGLTPTVLIGAAAWIVYTATGGRVVFELDATLAALLVSAIAAVAGWLKKDGALAGLGWSEISPKLLTLAISSGLVTTLVAIVTQLGFEPPAWVAGLAAAVLPLIPGYLKADAINPAHAPLEGHHVLVASDPLA